MYYLIEEHLHGTIVFGIKGEGAEYPDLCTNRDLAAALVRRCNEGQLAPWQLHDVVEDFVASLAFLETLP